MPERFVQSHIRKLPLFQRLTPGQLAEIANAFQVLRFEPGETVFQQGQPSQGMFVFVSGRGVLAQVGSDGVERPVGAVGENEQVNETALFVDGLENASLRVAEPSIVLFLSRHRLAQVMAHHPDIAATLQGQGSRFPDTPRRLFQGQREDETIIARLRYHWWSMGRRVWLALILAFVSLALGVASQSAALALGMMGLAVIIFGGFILYAYFEWRNDYIIVTDQRVVRVEDTILTFQNVISEIPIGNILEVNTVISPTDPFARIFNYGTVTIRTAGEAGIMKLDFMPRPFELQTMIFQSRDRYREMQAARTRTSIRAELDRSLGQPTGAFAAGSSQPTSATPRQQQNPSLLALILPLQMKFTNAQGETVYRKHWTSWLRHVFLPGLMILAGVILFVVAFLRPDALPGLGAITLPLAFFVMLVGGIWFYIADWDWRNDMYIVGDETITLIHKRPLWLQNQVDKILVSQVDNVESVVSGLFSSLFNVGDVVISLVGAAESSTKVFRSVSNPREVQAEISRRQARARMLREEAEANRQRQLIAEYLSVYHENIAPRLDNAQAQPPSQPPAPPEPPPTHDGTRPPGVPRVRPDEPPQ